METQIKLVRLISQEGEVVEFDERLQSLSQLVQNAEISEEIPTIISKNTLKFIQEFCEAHSYNSESMSYVYPFVSDKLKDNVDQITYELFWRLLGSVWNDIDKSAQLLCPILDAAFYLDFKKLMKIANVALQVRFYCSPTESGIQEFQERWGITEEDISGESRNRLLEENKPVFDAIKLQFKEKMDILYQAYDNGIRPQQ